MTTNNPPQGSVEPETHFTFLRIHMKLSNFSQNGVITAALDTGGHYMPWPIYLWTSALILQHSCAPDCGTRCSYTFYFGGIEKLELRSNCTTCLRLRLCSRSRHVIQCLHCAAGTARLLLLPASVMGIGCRHHKLYVRCKGSHLPRKWLHLANSDLY